MKRVILWACMCFATLSASAVDFVWPAGLGTSASPYEIATANDLHELAIAVKGGKTFNGVFFLMTADIDVSSICKQDGWLPIGIYGGYGFSGNFDGGGHTVSGMTIANTSDGQGLFGLIDRGLVRNLIVDACNINANNYVGAIVGYNSGTVSGCHVQNARINVVGAFCNGGGISGLNYEGKVTSCSVINSTLTCSHSTLGGICGQAYHAEVSDCAVSSTTLSGGTHMGGIIGSADRQGLVIARNYYSSDVSGVKGGVDGGDVNTKGSADGAVMQSPSMVAGVIQKNMPQRVSAAQQSPMAQQSQDGQQPQAAQPSVTDGMTMTVQAAGNAGGTSSSYIVKTKGVKPKARAATPTATATASATASAPETEPQDFMGKNFRFYSMCNWFDGMRFMVVPEKYDLLVNTFHDAVSGKEISSGKLRHKIMVYKGHEETKNGRVHVNFTCEDDGKQYYYELPAGTFEDYCFGKLGVPTLAYLGDVDKARELLVGKTLITRTQFFRIDTDYDSDGFKAVTVPKNKAVTVAKVGVGTRSFPVKIIVEDASGNQYYQCVAMSKTNCGMRDDEFIVDNEKFLFEGSFEYTDAEMPVSEDIASYLNKTIHTRVSTPMSSKGAGKIREVTVPPFMGFIVDDIQPKKGSRYMTLTLRELESRRIFYKDVAFSEDDVINEPNGVHEDFFGYMFSMGEGVDMETSVETRTAIREGRVIAGMTLSEVGLAVGEPIKKVTSSDGASQWFYPRTNSTLVVTISPDGIVQESKAQANSSSTPAKKKQARGGSSSRFSRASHAGGTWNRGTPL